MSVHFRKLALIGIGLIGSSIALAARRQGLVEVISIATRKQETLDEARELGLKILIGCMSETSCATLAAAALAPQCDWADLDGPFLISNNPYQMPTFADGRWVLNNNAGLGISLL